jgi:DNA-binding XRE family transcriptional regulator
MIIKIDGKAYKFVPLSKIIFKHNKSKRFREAYEAERARINLAHEITQLRRKKKMTQRQIAVRAAMPQSVIARIESGKHGVSVTTLNRIARALDKKLGFVEQEH